MTKADTSQTLTKLAAAAIKRASEDAWETISLADLCASAEVTLADCARDSITKAHIAQKLDVDLDQTMLADVAAVDQSQSVRDRLFDVLMARFDGMEENRAAWQSILAGEVHDPFARLARQARRTRAAAWALEAAGVTASDMRGAGRAMGLARILRLVEGVWREDGPELAKTMARLDQELRRGEEFVSRASDLGSLFSGFSFGRTRPPKRDEAVFD
jgi:ubiquinone biosynthesis protein COQ9